MPMMQSTSPAPMPVIFGGLRGPDKGGCFLYSRHFNPTVYVLDRQGKIRFKDLRGPALDKAVAELGYAPRYAIGAGLEHTIRWYQDHGWL